MEFPSTGLIPSIVVLATRSMTTHQGVAGRNATNNTVRGRNRESSIGFFYPAPMGNLMMGVSAGAPSTLLVTVSVPGSLLLSFRSFVSVCVPPSCRKMIKGSSSQSFKLSYFASDDVTTMAAISLCVIDRNNQPLYMREFIDDAQNTNLTSEEQLFALPVAKDGDGSSIGGFQCSVRHQFILHAALDRFEQLAGPPPGYGWRKTEDVSGMDAMFVGLLCPVEEMRVYGKSRPSNSMFLQYDRKLR